MKYYNAQDIKEITGLGKTACYDLIRELNEKLKKEYPGTIILQGKVPKWYLNKKLMIEEKENEKD